jgi:hypothetical protein
MDIDAAPTVLAQSDRPSNHVELLGFVWAGSNPSSPANKRSPAHAGFDFLAVGTRILIAGGFGHRFGAG